jgi:hypothetical protein
MPSEFRKEKEKEMKIVELTSEDVKKKIYSQKKKKKFQVKDRISRILFQVLTTQAEDPSNIEVAMCGSTVKKKIFLKNFLKKFFFSGFDLRRSDSPHSKVENFFFSRK